MAVYFVTGKLGAGKTLCAVGRIRDYLAHGRPVATNLDLNLSNLLHPFAKTPRLFRVPDKPKVEDLELIGSGNTTYDESKNGLLVLDECGTWFNARSWNDKTRQPVINWMLHARKLGWDVIFIIQDISIVDKQAREALAEHVVYCRRLDRLTLPVVGFLYSIVTGKKLPMPRVHLAVVKYGDQANALIVERWTYRGGDLYTAYDTKQAFTDYYEDGVYSLLTPWQKCGRYMVPRNWSYKMRITKIYMKKYSRITLFSLALLIGCFVGIMSFSAGVFFSQPVQANQLKNVVEEPAESSSKIETAEKIKPTIKLPEEEYSSLESTFLTETNDSKPNSSSIADTVGCISTERYCRCYKNDGTLFEITQQQCLNRSKRLLTTLVSYPKGANRTATQ